MPTSSKGGGRQHSPGFAKIVAGHRSTEAIALDVSWSRTFLGPKPQKWPRWETMQKLMKFGGQEFCGPQVVTPWQFLSFAAKLHRWNHVERFEVQLAALLSTRSESKLINRRSEKRLNEAGRWWLLIIATSRGQHDSEWPAILLLLPSQADLFWNGGASSLLMGPAEWPTKFNLELQP